MKKLVYLFLFLASNIHGQSLYELMSEEKLTVSFSYSDDVVFKDFFRSYQTSGTGTYCDLPVIRLYGERAGSNPNYFIPLYVDNEKIYLVDKIQDSCILFLLYDFSLSVGQRIKEGQFKDYVLTSIDSVELRNGELRKRYNFRFGAAETTWIYGIGDVRYGFFPSFNVAHFTLFQCAKINNDIVYERESFETEYCDSISCFDPRVDFDMEVDDFQVKFIDESLTGAEQFYWEFDDENYSIDQDPSHTYQKSGCYLATQGAFSDCHPDTSFISKRVNICISDAWETSYSFDFKNFDIVTLNNNTEIIFNEDNLLKTNNNGLSWDILPIPLDQTNGTPRLIQDIKFFDDQMGLMICRIPGAQDTIQTSIFRTIDGGESWVASFESVSAPYHFELGENGIAWTTVFEDQFLRTDDFGQTWKAYDAVLVPNLERLYYVNENTLFYTGRIDNTTMLGISSDQGATWDNVEVFGVINSVHFFDSQNAYAVINNKLFNTENGGKIWTKINSDLKASQLHFSSPTHGWIKDHVGAWHYTSNAIRDLELVHCENNEFTQFEIIDNQNAFVVERETLSPFPGTYITRKREFNVDLINNSDCDFEKNNKDIDGFIVSPNPASSQINIETSAFGDFAYSIYSIGGSLIATGSDQYEIDISRLANGTYILTLNFENGSLIQHSKFVVLR